MKKTIAILLINILIIVGVISIACSNVSYAATRGTSDNINEDNYQAIKSQIDQMKKDHPNWQFEILYTGLDWNTVIQNERNKNSVGTSYLGTKWTTGAYMEQNWVVATDLTTSYLMDVRYFLNENNVFQFLDLTYSGCDRQQIVNMVSGTFLNNTSYIDAIISAGQKYNVSPYFLTAKILQEQGPNPTSPLATGAKFTYNTEVYEGLYNLFNIGATGSPNDLLIRNGLRMAQLKGWTSIEKSIEGGADFIKTNYISRGQTSAYLQKFDVENSDGTLYSHQYMTNVFGAQSEGWKLKNTYQKYGGFDNSYKFTIPVYENMPKLTQNINLAKLNVSTTLSLKAEPSLASTKVGYESAGCILTVISKAPSANSTDGYYWDLVVFNNGMIGYMARGDSTKTYLASFKEMSIAPTGTVEITENYVEAENMSIIKAYSPQGFTANKDSSWKLSQDGKTYSKEYTENTDYNTTFTLTTGSNLSKEVKVTKVDENGINITKQYNEEKNSVVVSIYIPQGFTANKDSSWILSIDGKTYSKEYTENTNYYTTFTFKDGTTKNTGIRVESVDNNKVGITKQYNKETNIETVSVYNPQGFTSNKDDNWKLSQDGKTYTKEYTANTDYSTTFTLKNGTVATARIAFTDIEDNKLTLSQKYNPETNITTVSAYCSQQFTANKDVSWKLSADGRTYSKEFTANTNYTTTFTLKNGVKKSENIVVANIVDTNIQLTQNYNGDKNTVTVKAYNSQGFTANKDTSWSLSTDGKTYSKEFLTNINVTETFTLKSGYAKKVNIVVTSVIDNNITVSEKYNKETNISTAAAYCAQGFTANKDTSWKLSADGKTYSKEYTANTNYYTTFTLKNGIKKQQNIVVASIVDITTKVTQNLNTVTNIVTVNVYSNQGFTANKDTSWKLSQDTKTYSKEYNTNVNASETFTLKSGYIKQENIVVTSIVNNNVTVSEKYNPETNIATAVAYCASRFYSK